MEKTFNDKLKEDRCSANRLRTALSQRQYNIILAKVTATKLNKSHRTLHDILLLEKYDVTDTEPKRLVYPSTNLQKPIYYVHDQELFPIFLNAHLSTSHGNRDKMMKHLKKEYKNIAYKDIVMFLRLCKDCVKKTQQQPTEIDKRSAQFNNRCFIDFIDYAFSPDGDFKYIMIYKELFTKFSMLKPLKTKRPEEVADNLLNIFGILGPPAFLQSTCGTKFVEKVIDILKILWPSLEIDTIKSELTDSCTQDMESMVTSWMRHNKKTKWSEGIRFVQLKSNTVYNEEIGMTPYQALFKHQARVGFSRGSYDEEDEKMEDERKEEVENGDEGDEDGVENEGTNEMMEISKTEPKTMCGDCGRELTDEDVECRHCGGYT